MVKRQPYLQSGLVREREIVVGAYEQSRADQRLNVVGHSDFSMRRRKGRDGVALPVVDADGRAVAVADDADALDAAFLTEVGHLQWVH